ncbi:Multifunctional methyltransferase subunit TRM112-like protein, partial [Galemys pyrenaicus]
EDWPLGFLLHLQATDVHINPVWFSPNFLVCLILKMEWAVAFGGPIQEYECDKKYLSKMHHVLLKRDVSEGGPQHLLSGCLFLISC